MDKVYCFSNAHDALHFEKPFGGQSTAPRDDERAFRHDLPITPTSVAGGVKAFSEQSSALLEKKENKICPHLPIKIWASVGGDLMLLDRMVELAMIQQRIEESAALIERQREVVLKSDHNGDDTISAQIVLDSLVLSHSLLEEDLTRLRRKIGLDALVR